jgi:hypothetical protein
MSTRWKNYTPASRLAPLAGTALYGVSRHIRLFDSGSKEGEIRTVAET